MNQFLVVLHPIIPFITEEIWQQTKNITTLIKKVYPKEIFQNNKVKKSFKEIEIIKSTVSGIRNFRAEMRLSPKVKIDLCLDKK